MDHSWQRNVTLMGNATNLSMATNLTMAAEGGNSTFMVINEFKFLAARSIRTSTIILSVFNIVSAFATAAGILFDCYLKAKRSDPRRVQKVNIFRCVRGPETFPFVLSIGIVAQGIIFAISQAQGLDGLFKAGCSLISQFMWPAIFIVPYIQLVFGLEVVIRGFRTKPFPPRGKWDVAICLVVIKILLVITGLVAFFIRAPNFCFASLFWFVAKWAEGAVALFILIAVALALCIAFLYVKLTRHSTIETSERVGASRMIYYLVVAVLSNALIVPFFVSLVFTNSMDGGNSSSLTLATIASVVANVSGLLTGCLYLFLRSSTIYTISPRDKVSEYERQKIKYNIRLQSPEAMELDGRIIPSSLSPRSPRGRGSQENLIVVGKGNSLELGNNSSPLNSNPFTFNMDDFNSRNSYAVLNSAAMPRAPELAQMPTPVARPLGRRPSTSYSLFPSDQPNSNAVALLPSTTYSPNPNMGMLEPRFLPAPNSTSTLQPPPSMGPEGFRHHRRDSSLASHTTVQIGLRFSNVNDIGPIATKSSIEMERVHSLGCPNNPAPGSSQRPSPLARTQQAESIVSNAGSGSERSERPETMTSEIKSLTLVPAPSPTPQSSGLTLSPTVYTPPGTASTSPTKGKIISPRGVGFNMPKRINTTPEPSVTVPAPLRIRGHSDADKGREEWI